MSMVDCRGQAYARERSAGGGQGPSILVYYAPALMQNAGRKDSCGTLMLMADLYRQARSLWPLSGDGACECVSVRIDQLKGLELEDMEPPDGTVWVLEKLSSKEGAVQSAPLSLLADKQWAATRRQITLAAAGPDTARARVREAVGMPAPGTGPSGVAARGGVRQASPDTTSGAPGCSFEASPACSQFGAGLPAAAAVGATALARGELSE
eukprot:CAMPEP_0179373960 /NCGR_PEP_ID=MMETSP0797-20121207/87060_1 /TAXON_ID=47934 /ORGANISM="Dinophysis acuminata, Strain DAEP01" /LENGTH=209 /DNA_ID=CAMNT_0021089959 /DNA_START=1 /DNA_END=632 /DNA_ORIENTATION=+